MKYRTVTTIIAVVVICLCAIYLGTADTIQKPTTTYDGFIQNITVNAGGFASATTWTITMDNYTIVGRKSVSLPSVFVFQPDIIYTITVSDVYILSIEEMKQRNA